MFRRSRFSVRPNVGTAGRAAAAAPQEAPSASQDPSETPRDVGESNSGPSVTDDSSVAPETNTASGDANDQNGDGSSSSAALQRRKRFSVKPKVAPGRPTPLARTAKSPVKPVSETAVEVSGSDVDKPSTSSQPGPAAASLGLRSPKRWRLSEDGKLTKVQPKATHIPSESKAQSAVPPAENALKPADSGKQLESTTGSQVKDASLRVPLFIPDKEAIELSEKAKTLVSSKSRLSLSPSALSLSRLLNDPSDLQRLEKAQKLKEMLRAERTREKLLKKAKSCVKTFTLDPTKMTMRDLLHYIPNSNPMSSTLESSTQEEETVIPASPGREDRSPERAQQPEVTPKVMSPREEADEEADEEQEDSLMVPRVKVAEDGSLIIDEESLTVEVQRAKGPNPAHDRDPIFERGSTTTYSSFRKGTISKPWSSEETDMFFLAISMVGTDFSMICQLFPHRARAEIKNKFKKEERENAWRIDKAFRDRRRLDIEYFSKLLEKIMEVQKNRKKLRSLAEKVPKKRKAKGKKASRKLSEEEDEEDENLSDLEDEEGGEKENELLCNEDEATASKPTKQRKRKTDGEDASQKEPSKKKRKMGEKSCKQDELCTPQDSEAALPEDPTNSDVCVNSGSADAEDSTVKPAKLSRGRAPKPLVPLGRKWGKKAPPPSTEAQGGGDQSVADATSKQVNEAASPSKISANEDTSSEEEEAPVAQPRPTRYGRVPKPTKPLAYPCKADGHPPVSGPTPSSPAQHAPSAAKPTGAAKRGRPSAPQSVQESKKIRLITLRASQSDCSDDEGDQQWEPEEGEEEQNPACSPSKESAAPVFVPAGLRSPQPRVSVVEETMEELDMLANMPDVLGISQDALCPDASCEQAHNETCDHQLDLLVDVIDFLSSEHTEVTEDESYNEAAQTLLAIGNLYSQSQTDAHDHVPGTTSNGETSPQPGGEMPPDAAAHEQSAASCESAAFGSTGAESTEIPGTKQQAANGDNDQTSNGQGTSSDTNHVPQFQSSPESLQKSSPQTMLTVELCPPSLTDCSFEEVNQERGSMCSQAELTESESSSTAPGLSVTESQVEERLKTDSVQGQEDGARLDVFVKLPAEDLPVASPLQPRRNRTQKVKPNLPQTCRAAQSKPRVAEASKETDCSRAPIPEATAEDESEPSCSTAPEKPTENAALVSDLEPSLNLGSAEDQSIAEEKNVQPRRSRTQKVKPNLPQTCRAARSKARVTEASKGSESSISPVPKPTVEPSSGDPPEKPPVSTGPVSELSESQDLSSSLTKLDEQCTAEEKNTDDATLAQRDSGAAGGSSAENTNIAVDSFQPRSEQAAALPGSVPEKPMHDAKNVTCDSNVATELLVTQSPTLFAEDPKVTRNTEMPDAGEEVEDQSACTTDTSQSGGTAASVASLESPDVGNGTEERKADVGFALESSSESSGASVAHRRRRAVKVKPKPNLTSSIKATRSNLHPKGTSNGPEQRRVDTSVEGTREQQSEQTSSAQPEPEPTDTDGHNLTSERSTDCVTSDAAASLDRAGEKDGSSASASTQGADVCSISTVAVPEEGSGVNSTGSAEEEVRVSSQSACKADVSTGTAALRAQPPGGSGARSGVQMLEGGCTKSEIHLASSTDAELVPDGKGSCPDASQTTTEATESSQTPNEKSQCTDGSQSASSGSAFMSKARPPHRGRLIKPKPNLARSSISQLPKVQQAQNETQAQADSSAYSKDVDASVSHKSVSDPRPAPVEGAAEQEKRPEPPSDDAVAPFGAESSLGCLSHVPPAQGVSPPASEGSQSHPCLALFSDMLPEQVPSDPDEPFFILSLTEIPVSSSGEVVDSAAEPLSYLPVTHASIPQQSSPPGEHVGAAAGDGPLSDVPVLASTEERDETSRIDANDSGLVQMDSIIKNPEDVHHEKEKATIQSPKTVENSNDVATTPTKPKPRGTARKAKMQEKPTKARTKQGSRALAPNSVQPVQPDACDATAGAGDEVIAEPQAGSRDQVEIVKETPACADVPEVAQTKAAHSRREPKDSTASPSIPPPAEADSPCGAVRPTPSPAEARSAPATASATQTQTQVPAEDSAARRPDQVSASQDGDCAQSSSIEEEPTSVSQYFLSDIFTDVAET